MADSDANGRIVWYELLTSDMEAAKKFYTKTVGWTTQPFDGSPAPYEMWVPPSGAPIGGVMPIPEGMNFPPHWVMYVSVPNIDQAIANVQQLGGKTLSPPIDVPNVGRMRTMLDPQGAMFSLIEPAPGSPDTPETPPDIGATSWHELYTTDAPAAMKFYSGMFGWKQTQEMDMGPMGKYYIFGRKFDLGGMMNKAPEMAQVPPFWGFYFRVQDVHQGAERVKANGGKILNGPMEVPGGDMIVNCMDPQGAAFSLHHKKA
jgi:predicted enzyme related to lactoylglutathione lyase